MYDQVEASLCNAPIDLVAASKLSERGQMLQAREINAPTEPLEYFFPDAELDEQTSLFTVENEGNYYLDAEDEEVPE